MQRAVGSLPLSSCLLAKLTSYGFENVDDLSRMGVVELSREIRVSNSEALEIVQVAKRTYTAPTTLPSSPHHRTPHHTTSHHSGLHSLSSHSALELLRREQVHGSIVTFCAGIDGMMGGGVALGKVTELCGAPGLGKTQLGIQLAVDVSIPEILGGVEGEAVYIDTEGSFIVERVAEVATAAVCHLKSMEDANCDEAMKKAACEFSLETVLSSIHLYHCQHYTELLALLNILPDFIKHHPKVRLVVIDSIAAHFRHGFTDMSQRNRLLSVVSQNLIKLATSHNIAVVLTNQMTTKVCRGQKNSAQLVPALGESWGHASTVRVILFWSGSERRAVLYKSPTHRETTVSYVITADGIRDPLSADGSSLPPIAASQCVTLCEDFSEPEDGDDAQSDTDYIMANIRDPAVWIGEEGRGGEGDVEERVGGRDDVEPSNDFVSVSSLHSSAVKTEQERSGRKRPRSIDSEL